MTLRKVLFSCLLLSFTMIIMSSCWTVMPTAPLEPMAIWVGHRVFQEVSQDTIQKLNLSVASCSGLSEVGEIEEQGGHTYGTAYAHPDERYPNLVVALIDEKVTIFQFTNFDGRITADIDEVKNIYGLSTADSISEISIRRQQIIENAVSTVTDKEEIAKFFDALSDFSAIKWGYGESSSSSFPVYYFDVGLSNGFSLTFEYYPKRELFYFGCVFFTCSDLMLEWVNTQLTVR